MAFLLQSYSFLYIIHFLFAQFETLLLITQQFFFSSYFHLIFFSSLLASFYTFDTCLASCRYEKSQWTECNPETNVRTRTLSLKKGDEGCIPTRTIQKKCKKGKYVLFTFHCMLFSSIFFYSHLQSPFIHPYFAFHLLISRFDSSQISNEPNDFHFLYFACSIHICAA